MMTEGLCAEKLTYHRPSFAINDVSVYFPKQKVTSIIGPNGSGKSTILKLLTNLITPEDGIVRIDGKDVSSMKSKQLARKMTMLSQSQSNHLDLTVRELISHGRLPHRKWYEKLSLDDEEKIDWAISVTQLTHLQYKSIQELSGGERQRAWIAMAVVQSPDILLLDEPTTYLDISHQLEVMELVHYLNHALEMTIVMVLHDINQAAKYSDHLIVVKDGTIITHGKPREIINQTMFHDVFSIHVKIDESDGYPAFTPIRLANRNTGKFCKPV